MKNDQTTPMAFTLGFVAVVCLVIFGLMFGISKSDAVRVRNTTDQAELRKLASAVDSDVRRAAVRKLDDQAILAKIAVEDKDQTVRQTALRQITNQGVLAELAAKTHDMDTCDIALHALTNQTMLTEFALKGGGREEHCYFLMERAARRLTDPVFRAEVALRTTNSYIADRLYHKLDNKKALAGLAAAPGEAAVRPYSLAFLKVYYAIQPVPEEHRLRVFHEVSAIVNALMDSRLAAELGEIEVIRAGFWEPFVVEYTGGSVRGEDFRLIVKVKNSQEIFFHQWTTDFPDSVPYGTRRLPAKINTEEFLGAPCDILSDTALALVANKSESSSLRRAASERLAMRRSTGNASSADTQGARTNLVAPSFSNLLSSAGKEIRFRRLSSRSGTATGNAQSYIPKTSSKHGLSKGLLKSLRDGTLTDQLLLAKIALEDEDPSARCEAVKNLIDQSLLARIALGDKVAMVRSDATATLVNQESVVAQIATLDADLFVRCRAVRNLTDEALLAKIALEERMPVVREAAEQKLANLRKFRAAK